MLVCNVSLSRRRASIAASVAEVAAALDAPGTGNVVFATLVDDPANVRDRVDAFLGQIMLEAASAAAAVSAGLVYAATITEAATAADTVASVLPISGTVAETVSAADAPDATFGAWTPAALGSALRAWYKMDALTGSNGSLQGTIADASGNSFTLTQATGGNQGSLVAPGLNSLNTLRFVSATFYPMSASIMSGSSAGSLYLVFRVTSEASNNGLMDWGSSGSDSHWPYLDGVFYNDFGSTVRKTVGNPTASFVSDYRILSIYSAASDWAFYIDGGAGGSSGGTSPFFSTATNTVGWKASGINLGRNTGGAVLDGWIAEMVFTNAKQSTTDRQKMEGFLAHKWGLTGNLSSSHPYKSAPP
jgi:hypothetical protein